MPKKREVIGVQEVFLHESKNENGTLRQCDGICIYSIIFLSCFCSTVY